MSVLYNSKKRKVRPWVPVLFVTIPILLAVGIYSATKGKVVEINREKEQKAEEDIFDRF